MLLDLLESSGLISWLSLRAPAVATKVLLQRFHSEAYVNALEASDPALSDTQTEVDTGCNTNLRNNSSNSSDDGSGGGDDDDDGESSKAAQRPFKRQRDEAAEREEFGLVDECAPFPGVFQYACAVAGASLQVVLLYTGTTSRLYFCAIISKTHLL